MIKKGHTVKLMGKDLRTLARRIKWPLAFWHRNGCLGPVTV
jgi:hypothetical protein